MFFENLINNAQLFFLVFARIVALLMMAPLFNSQSMPGIARVGLALLTAVAVFPRAQMLGYPVPLDSGTVWVFLMIGEVMVGLIIAFFLVLIFSTFQVAGQFFSIQMGFGASQVFDPMAQIQIPLMGQFFNMIALYVFLVIDGFPKLFIIGIGRSFDVLTAGDILVQQKFLTDFFVGTFSGLFAQALIIALPMVGTLFLISVTTGLLAKAAPQMNLLMIGFPIQIGVAFVIIILCVPLLVNHFAGILSGALDGLAHLISETGGPP